MKHTGIFLQIFEWSFSFNWFLLLVDNIEMKKIIIIFYHNFFYKKFTIYLRFNYTCNKKRV